MKILVINVCLRPYLEQLVPPVGLGYILTAMRDAGFEFELLDIDANRYSSDEVERLIRTNDFDIAAFGCLVSGYKIVKWLSAVIKEKSKSIPVIIGNSVATSMPTLLLTKTQADIAVLGEGDITVVELLKALVHGVPLGDVPGICYKDGSEIKITPERKLIENVDDVPNVDWNLFDIEAYLSKSRILVPEPYMVEYDSLRAMPVNSARGCIHKCDFCYHVFRGKRYRARSAGSICAEIKALKTSYDINFIHFYDELTLYSRRQCHDLCDEIMREALSGIVYSACARADLLGEDDYDLAVKLKKAGFHHIGYSIESADPDILRAMNKRLTVDKFMAQTRVLQEAGIFTETALVIGYPQETAETIQKSFDVCRDANIYPSAGYLVPQPGTPIYEYAREAGIINDEEEYLLNVIGDRQDFRINLTKMKQDDIENIVKINLRNLSKKLNLDLDETKLIKTGHYKTVGTSTH